MPFICNQARNSRYVIIISSSTPTLTSRRKKRGGGGWGRGGLKLKAVKGVKSVKHVAYWQPIHLHCHHRISLVKCRADLELNGCTMPLTTSCCLVLYFYVRPHGRPIRT